MSVLPPPQKDGEIKFFIAKSLPYRQRMALVALLLACGVALQLTAGFWPGFAVLVLGQLLGMNSGYNSTPKTAGYGTWERVSPDEYVKVKTKAAELKKWDEDIFDATSGRGQFGLLLAIVLCLAAYFKAVSVWNFPEGFGMYMALDAAVLIIPLWFIGTREYLNKDKLIIKIDMLSGLMDNLKGASEVQVYPMLSLVPTGSGGKEPDDARLMVKLVGAPEDFYGVQVQLSINSVQGKDFPYLYCVLIAKHGSGLLDGFRGIAGQPERSAISGMLNVFFSSGGCVGTPTLVYEPQSQDEVDIIVVRQQTSTSSGYCTPPYAARTIVDYSLRLAAGLLEKNARTAV